METSAEREIIKKTIHAQLEKFCRALKSKDLKILHSFFHKDVIFIPYDSEVLYGRNKVYQYYEKLMNKCSELEMAFADIKINIAPPNALVVGKWETKGSIRRQIYNLKSHDKTEEENVAASRGRFSALFQKEGDDWLMLQGHSSASLDTTEESNALNNLFFDKFEE